MFRDPNVEGACQKRPDAVHQCVTELGTENSVQLCSRRTETGHWHGKIRHGEQHQCHLFSRRKQDIL